MRLTSITISVALLCAAATVSATDSQDNPSQQVQVTRNIASMPLAFTENQGQWDDHVLFRANAGGATMWFTCDGAYYQFTRRVPRDDTVSDNPVHPGLDRFDREPDSIETMMIKASFVGANPNPRMVGQELMEYKCNYFLGNDPDKWRTDVPNYQAIVYENIYDGIDVRFSGAGNGQVTHEFIAAPGADLSQIEVAYEGEVETSVDDEGRLVVTTAWGNMLDAIGSPDACKGTASPSLYATSENSFGVEFDGQTGDQAQSRAVTLVYSTYLGGSSTIESGRGIAVDASGAAYVTGYTKSPDFPTENPYQTYQWGRDVFVTKLSNSGNSLVYSTYLGGNNSNDYGWGIAVDAAGAAYVTGETASTDFPTLNPYQGTKQGHRDAFVTKLSSSGNSLLYSTYLGGTDTNEGYGIAVDASGSAYVTGVTSSTDFPTLNPYQGTHQGGVDDIFVTKLGSSGSSLVYSTYLGGSDQEEGQAIAVDASGAAYVTGWTISPDFPTKNPYQTNQGRDVFVTKLSGTGNDLEYSTCLGGASAETGYGIAVDDYGHAFVTGLTASLNFPTENPYQAEHGGGGWPDYDAFVTKLSNSGNSLVWSTYLGGGGSDLGRGIAVDGNGCAFVTGFTLSTYFPVENPYQTNQAWKDVFVTKLNSSGNGLIYSTYLGGSSSDDGYGIAVDGNGNAYVTGFTSSSDFPTENPYQTDQGDCDVFVTKLSAGCDYEPPIANAGGPYRGDPDEQITFNASDSYDPDGTIDLYEWDWDNNGTYDDSYAVPTATHSWPNTGNYTVGLRVTDNDSQTDEDEAEVVVDAAARVLIDSVRVWKHETGTYQVKLPDNLDSIEVNDRIRVYGRVLDVSGIGIPSHSLTCFDAFAYGAGELPTMDTVLTDAAGNFAFPDSGDQPVGLLCAHSDLYPFWFAANDLVAIPVVVEVVDETTTLEALTDSLIAYYAPTLEDLTDDTVYISIPDTTDPLFIAFHHYPPNADDLDDPSNDEFMEGFAHCYHGPTDFAFLFDSTESNGNAWLNRGSNLVNARIVAVADSLKDYVTIERSWKVLAFRDRSGAWHNVASQNIVFRGVWDNIVTAVTWGVEAGICAGAIVGTLGIGAPLGCAPLVIHAAAEIAKAVAVPVICDDIVKAEDPEQCRSVGNTTVDVVAGVASLVVGGGVTKLGPATAKHLGYWHNVRNLAGGGINGKAKAGAMLYHNLVDWAGAGKTAFDATRLKSQVFHNPADENIESYGIYDLIYQPDDQSDILYNTEVGFYLTMTEPPGQDYDIYWDDPFNPYYLCILVVSNKPYYEDGTGVPIPPTILAINYNDTLVIDTAIIVSDPDNCEYYMAVPYFWLPGYILGQFWTGHIRVLGGDIFSNHGTDSTSFCTGHYDGESNLTLTMEDGSSAYIPQGAYDSTVNLSLGPSQGDGSDRPGPRGTTVIRTLRGAVSLSPTNLQFGVPVEIGLKVHNLNLIEIADTVLAVTWFDTLLGDWTIIGTTLDTSNMIVSGETSKSGRFVVALITDYICGDIDASGALPVDIADLVYLVDWMFSGGPEPPVMEAADVDGSGGMIDIADLVYLVDFMFNGGPELNCP